MAINGNTVTKTVDSWDHSTAIVSDAITLRRGSSVKKRWSFTVKRGLRQTIGVVTSAFNAVNDQYMNKTPRGWGYYQGDGKKGHNGPASTVYGRKYSVGDVIDGVCTYSLCATVRTGKNVYVIFINSV